MFKFSCSAIQTRFCKIVITLRSVNMCQFDALRVLFRLLLWNNRNVIHWTRIITIRKRVHKI